MNYTILFIISITILGIAAVIALPVIKKLRYAFDVPEGWVGLVYQHGLYVRRNNAGRHVLWGLGWTVKFTDLRKTSLLVAGQEVLTADNVGLKLSLLVTYQVTEPVKAAPGFRVHTAYPVDGGFAVTEIWDDARDHKVFFESAVKPNIPDGVPFQVEVTELHNTIGL